MIKVGLTGSIGMGKSTTSAMFVAEGFPMFDADAMMQEVYKDPVALAEVEKLFPGVLNEDGSLNKKALSARVMPDPDGLKRLEKMVHPFLGGLKDDFLVRHADDHDVVLFDVPLLFETGFDQDMDVTIVVSCPAELQKQRVLARPGMTEEKLAGVLARQMPDEEKQRRALFTIDTSKSLDDVREQVRNIATIIRKTDWYR
jgi:dephospho-CoA kinase